MRSPRPSPWPTPTRTAVGACAGLVALASATVARAEAPSSAPDERPSVTDTSTSSPWFRDVRLPEPMGLEPERLVLSLPGSIIELAFVPLVPVIVALERYKVVERVWDLITNDELTFAAAPLIEPFNASGLGLGAAAISNAPLGSPDRIVGIGLLRLNGDRLLSLSYGRRLPELSGRVIDFALNVEVDRDINWFGRGSDQSLDDQRLLRRDEALVTAGMSQLFPGIPNVDGAFRLGFRRRGLFTGDGVRAPALVPNDGVELPPGFGETLDYLEAGFRFRVDTRDGLGRTTRGLVWTIDADGSRELSSGEDRSTGGVRTTSQLTVFLPVLPLHRVLVLSAGVSAAFPVFDGEEVALHQLVNLGGSSTLRGYQNDRFIERLGWWGTAEYRFLLSDYGDSILGFSGSAFVDVGRVGRNLEEVIPGSIPWSVGLGLLAETDILLIGRVQVAVSPDGVNLSVGVGEFF